MQNRHTVNYLTLGAIFGIVGLTASPLSAGNPTWRAIYCPVESVDHNYSEFGWSRTLASCDSSGNIYEELFQWKSGSDWTDAVRTTRQFDDAGRLIETVIQDRTGSVWLNRSRMLRGYNTDGRLAEFIEQVWEDGAWLNVNRDEYGYTPEGWVNRLTRFVWTEDPFGYPDADWGIVGGTSHTHDASGNVIASRTGHWAGYDIDWTSITANFYDESGNLVERIVQTRTGVLWSNQWRTLWTYGSTGLVVDQVTQGWSGSGWQDQDRLTYAYDGYGREIEHTRETWTNGAWTGNHRTRYEYDVFGNLTVQDAEIWREGQWTFNGRIETTWAAVTSTAVDEDVVASEAAVLYQNHPNPFQPATSIRFDLPVESTVRLRVFDLLGREVSVLVDGRHPAGTHTVDFDATGLASGTYLYTLETPGRMLTRTMVLLR